MAGQTGPNSNGLNLGGHFNLKLMKSLLPVLFKSEVPVHKKCAMSINAINPFDLFEFPSSIATPAITVQAT